MREIFYGQAIHEALREETARDEAVHLLGIDVRVGPFGVTTGLVQEFGPERVINTPIAESCLVGAATGMALAGLRPIAELMFADFAYVAMDSLANQMAQYSYMTGGQVRLPMVVRTASGAGMGVGYNHSQCTEATFLGIPGVKIVAPATPYDAKGLLKAAIRDPNPVLFFEHKLLYGTQGEVPAGEYLLPIGRAEIKRPGQHVTVVAVQAMVPKALAAAATLAERGIEVEVIDPRTLVPLDLETILASVRKTGYLITAEESRKRHGVGAMITAAVTEEGFDYLEAAPVRVAAPDVPVPCSMALERLYIPGHEQIVAAVEKLLGR